MDSITYFTNLFTIALLKCTEKFERKRKLYHGTWRTCSISYLEERLLKEAAAFIQDRDEDTLVDIANFALMVLQRRALPRRVEQ